jgi:hypothetical protein
VETAEKKVRVDTTQVPTWIALIEGSAMSDVQAAGDLLEAALRPYLTASGRSNSLVIAVGVHPMQDSVECGLTANHERRIIIFAKIII